MAAAPIPVEVSLYKLYSLRQIFCDQRGTQALRPNKLAVFTLPSADKNRTASRAVPCFNVRKSISNHVRLRQGQSQIASRTCEHADTGFPARAALAQPPNHGIWVVKAI